MRRRKINVRKHQRTTPSGKITSVRKHYRMIHLRKNKRKTQQQLEKERRAQVRTEIRRKYQFPLREKALIDLDIIDDDDQIRFVSAEEAGTESSQVEGMRRYELLPSTELPSRIRTEMGISQRLEDRLSEPNLKTYLLLRKEIPLTDEDGNIRYDEYDEPIMEETQLVLPPLPVPGKLTPDEIFELKRYETLASKEDTSFRPGFVIDDEGKLVFDRVMGEDHLKTQEKLAKELEGLDPNSTEFQEKLNTLMKIQQNKQWVVFDLHGMPILADHVSVYAIKGVDAEVGDLLHKMEIYTVHDYMEWRRKLADKKIRDDKSDIVYNLIETLDEYNRETIRDRIHDLEQQRKKLTGTDSRGIKYSDLVTLEIEEELDPSEMGTLTWINRMQRSIERVSMQKERDDAIRAGKFKQSRKGLGGRPKDISNRELDERKKYYNDRVKTKLIRGKDPSYELRKLNTINHEIKIRKSSEKVKKIDNKVNLDELGQFMVASSYFTIKSNETVGKTRKKYQKKRTEAIKTLKDQGFIKKNGVMFYPKPALAKELGVKAGVVKWPVEFQSDIIVVDNPRGKMQEHWHYAELGEIRHIDPKTNTSKKAMQLQFDEKIWAQKTKAQATSSSLLKSRQQILRSGTSYFDRDQLQRAYAIVKSSDDVYKLAEDAGFTGQKYLIRGQLRDKDEIESVKGDWKFKGKTPLEKEFFEGSMMAFETKRAVIAVEPIISHYGKNKDRSFDVEKELKKKVK